MAFTNLYTKIRALVNDAPAKSDYETFVYSNDSTFDLSEDNIQSITKVTKNGSTLGSGDYSYDSITNELTITATLTANDVIIVKYTFTKYSDSELTEYITAALVWLSIYSYCEEDYEVETGDIYPTPDNKTLDLICIIASILINPSYSEYRLPNVTVRYPRTMTKENRIKKLIHEYKFQDGVVDTLEWD